jgi:hypothetical protein
MIFLSALNAVSTLLLGKHIRASCALLTGGVSRIPHGPYFTGQQPSKIFNNWA